MRPRLTLPIVCAAPLLALAFAASSQAATPPIERLVGPALLSPAGDVIYSRDINAGSEVTCDPGTVTTAASFHINYIWSDTNGSIRQQGSSNAYTPSNDDVGYYIGCQVEVIDDATGDVLNTSDLHGSGSYAEVVSIDSSAYHEAGSARIDNVTEPAKLGYDAGDVLSCNAGNYPNASRYDFYYYWYDNQRLYSPENGDDVFALNADPQSPYLVVPDASPGVDYVCYAYTVAAGSQPLLGGGAAQYLEMSTLYASGSRIQPVNPSYNQNYAGGGMIYGDNYRCEPGLTPGSHLTSVDYEYSFNNGQSWQASDVGPVTGITCSFREIERPDFQGAGPGINLANHILDVPYIHTSNSDTQAFHIGDDITCDLTSFGSIDPDHLTNIRYLWSDGVEDQTRMTKFIYEGTSLSCTVTATVVTDNQSFDVSSDSSADFYIHEIRPEVPPTPDSPSLSVDGAPTWGHVASCQASNLTDLDAGFHYEYSFDRDGGEFQVQQSTANTYTLHSSDTSGTLTCAVVIVAENGPGAEDDTVQDRSGDSNVVALEGPMHSPHIGILGDPHVGQMLTCEVGTWNTNGAGTTQIQWYQSGENSGPLASGATYVPKDSDLGKRLVCTSLLQDGEATVGREDSTRTNPISPFPTSPKITITEAPSQGGEAVAGTQLTCDLGADTQSLTNASQTYTWLLDGQAVSTERTYQLTEANVGHTIACRIVLDSDQVKLTVTTQAFTVRTAQPVPPVIIEVPGPTVVVPGPTVIVPGPTTEPTPQPLDACSPTNDLIIGTPGPDNICGGGGDDIIYGGDGNDQITGDAGNDTIYGGDGNDAIDAGSGDNLVRAGSGNDRVHAGAGNDVIYGDAGYDTISTGDGTNIVYAGNGGSRVVGGKGADRVIGGSGVDKISTGLGNDWIATGSHNDVINAGGGIDVVFSGSGNDVVHGGTGDDVIYGGAGNDRLYGDAQGDKIYGGPGQDKLFGGSGYDVLYGGWGQDQIHGDRGLDILWGNSGIDILFADKLDRVILTHGDEVRYAI